MGNRKIKAVTKKQQNNTRQHRTNKTLRKEEILLILEIRKRMRIKEKD